MIAQRAVAALRNNMLDRSDRCLPCLGSPTSASGDQAPDPFVACSFLTIASRDTD
jgi:hypothetical protein